MLQVKVGVDSRDEQRQGDGDASLDDKQPPPASDAMRHMKIPQDARTDEPTKGVCEGASCIEPGDTVAQFLAGIPARPARRTILAILNKYLV